MNILAPSELQELLSCNSPQLLVDVCFRHTALTECLAGWQKGQNINDAGADNITGQVNTTGDSVRRAGAGDVYSTGTGLGTAG